MGIFGISFTITASALLPWHVGAHYCDNGQRVTCIDVQSTAGAPSTHGRDAHGSALCTPEGQKVFCLVDHNYHECGALQAPCCADGSNPYHHGHARPSSENEIICTPTKTTLKNQTANQHEITTLAASQPTVTEPEETTADWHDSGLSWVLGETDEDCHTTCLQAEQSCDDEAWPTTLEAFRAVASRTAGLQCKSHDRGTWAFNPAVCIDAQSSHCNGMCFWEGAGSRCRGGVGSHPSPIARRICPCRANKLQTVLDDSSGPNHHMHFMENAFPGTYVPCMKDAYNGQFHHDWSQNKGQAHFSYRFDPSKSGCYLLEEYHPGGDEMCAQYLPSNTKLDVDYCKGLSSSHYIDQGSNGAQWNPVGKFMFFEGTPGFLTMRNGVGEQCRSPPCFWLADAFRLTWMEQQCRPDVTLIMNLCLDPESTEDVLPQMKEHKSTLQTTLEAHFGYESVYVLDIAIAGRRLAHGEEAGSKLSHKVKLSVPLLVFGSERTTEVDLGRALQKALADVGVGVYIDSAAVVWTTEPRHSPIQTSETHHLHPFLPLILICVGAVLLLTIGFAIRCWQLKRMQPTSHTSKVCALGPEGLQDLENVTAADDSLKNKGEQWEMESVSTATPSIESVSDEVYTIGRMETPSSCEDDPGVTHVVHTVGQ